jgi:hypothetical protein
VDNNGNVISYSSSANRKAFEKQLEVAIQKDEQLTTKIQTYNDSIINLETRIVETQNNSEVAAELGPLKYLANLTGVEMDRIINWFLLVIIFVFDPLAISLVVAANFAFAQLKKKDDALYPDSQDEPEDSDIKHDFENDEELEEASLVDLQKWEEEKPIPVFMDPKTGKLYYEEPDPIDTLPDEVIDEILEGEEFTIDKDDDGEISEEELLDYIDIIDLDNSGNIDLEEAKKAGVSPEILDQMNKLKSLLGGTLSSDPGTLGIRMEIEYLKQQILQEINRIKKKDDDDTITVF